MTAACFARFHVECPISILSYFQKQILYIHLNKR